MTDFEKINNEAMSAIRTLVKKQPLSVISVNKAGTNWEALVEVLEREAIPDTQNLIGIYKMSFDSAAKLLGYKRVEMRRKGDVGSEGPAEEQEK